MDRNPTLQKVFLGVGFKRVYYFFRRIKIKDFNANYRIFRQTLEGSRAQSLSFYKICSRSDIMIIIFRTKKISDEKKVWSWYHGPSRKIMWYQGPSREIPWYHGTSRNCDNQSVSAVALSKKFRFNFKNLMLIFWKMW